MNDRHMVLLQGAGDTLHAVRCRHDGIAAAVGVAPADLGHALELIDQIAPLPPWSEIRTRNSRQMPVTSGEFVHSIPELR